MTAVPITLTRRPRTTGRPIASRTPAPTTSFSSTTSRPQPPPTPAAATTTTRTADTAHDTGALDATPTSGAPAWIRMRGMPTARITYHDLPQQVRTAIEEVTGPVASAVSASDGFNSAVAARLSTPAGDRFCKALPANHRWVWTQQREAAIAPYLNGVAPALVGRLDVDGWDVLVFEALNGHHADYRPGSPDLPAVVTLLEAIAGIPCPQVELRDAGQRLRTYVNDPADVHHFTGTTMLHTDLNPANVIVDADRARIVDWGWATRGAPWLDPAYWVLWLIAAGHDPAAAEQWASKVPAWHTATRDGVDAFAHAQAALWTETGGRNPDDPWTARLAALAQRWTAYRRRGAE